MAEKMDIPNFHKLILSWKNTAKENSNFEKKILEFKIPIFNVQKMTKWNKN